MLTIDQAALPLDLARGASLRFLSRSRLLTRVLGRRDTRIAVLGSAQILFLFALTLRFPVALYFVGPIVLGGVHVAADVRYLALRMRPPRSFLVASAVLGAVFTAVRVFVRLHVANPILGVQAGVALGITWVGLALALRLRASRRALAVAAPIFAAAAALVLVFAPACDLLLTHLHNVAALVLWLSLFRRRPGWTALPVALVVVATALLLSGACMPWTAHHGGLAAFGEPLFRLGQGLAPGAAPRLAAAIAMGFVFLQSVHYAVWTAWIPQDCLPGEGTPTFRMTMRSLVADFRPLALAVVVGLLLLFAASACWDLRQSFGWYLTLVRAHAWFEVAAFAFFVGRRHAPCTERVA